MTCRLLLSLLLFTSAKWLCSNLADVAHLLLSLLPVASNCELFVMVCLPKSWTTKMDLNLVPIIWSRRYLRLEKRFCFSTPGCMIFSTDVDENWSCTSACVTCFLQDLIHCCLRFGGENIHFRCFCKQKNRKIGTTIFSHFPAMESSMLKNSKWCPVGGLWFSQSGHVSESKAMLEVRIQG